MLTTPQAQEVRRASTRRVPLRLQQRQPHGRFDDVVERYSLVVEDEE
jgi:hypothetical protein